MPGVRFWWGGEGRAVVVAARRARRDVVNCILVVDCCDSRWKCFGIKRLKCCSLLVNG